MSAVVIAVIAVLGVAVASVIFAYVPIMLIISYNLTKRELAYQDWLTERYVRRDDISTEEFIERVEGREVRHMPLRKDA